MTDERVELFRQQERIAELEAENERLSMAIIGLLSWCEEIAGDNLDKNAAAHEMATTQQAIDVTKTN